MGTFKGLEEMAERTLYGTEGLLPSTRRRTRDTLQSQRQGERAREAAQEGMFGVGMGPVAADSVIVGTSKIPCGLVEGRCKSGHALPCGNKLVHGRDTGWKGFREGGGRVGGGKVKDLGNRGAMVDDQRRPVAARLPNGWQQQGASASLKR